MAEVEVLPSLFNNPRFEKDPILFDQKPEVILIPSEYTCLTNVDLNNLDNLELFTDSCYDDNQQLFDNTYLIDQEVVVGFDQTRDESTAQLKTELETEDEVETDSGRGSISESESMETVEDEEEEEEVDEEEEDEESAETLHQRLLEYLDRFAAESKIEERARKRAASDFDGLDTTALLNCHPADLWKLNCEVGLEFQNFLRRLCPESSKKPSTPKPLPAPRRSWPARRQSCRRRKVYIHTFCLDLLLHPQKYGSVVAWTDLKALTFRVLDTRAVAHLWCLVKGNTLEDYETFGRGIRFSMARGFFTRMRPQKKKTYRLTERALRNYNTYRPGLVSQLRR